jgi:hypothetical protein
VEFQVEEYAATQPSYSNDGFRPFSGEQLLANLEHTG